MPHEHAFPRATPLLCLALLLGGGLPLLAPSAEAGTRFFEEDWEAGSAGWTYSADQPVARRDCAVVHAYRDACSLEIEAQAQGLVSSASRDLDLLVDAPDYVVSFYFRNDWPYMRSHGWFTMKFADGGRATVNLSYGPGVMVSLSTGTANTGHLDKPNGEWWMYEEQTWYRVVLLADRVAQTLAIEVRSTEDGSLLATAPALKLPSTGAISRVSFEGSYTGRGSISDAPQKINYDLLTIAAPDAPGAPCLLKTLPGPGLGEVTVSWEEPSDDGGAPVLRYDVYRGDAADDVTTHIGSTTGRSFVDARPEGGTTRYYAVRAVNAAGEGAWSDPVLAAAPHALIASTGLALVSPEARDARLAVGPYADECASDAARRASRDG